MPKVKQTMCSRIALLGGTFDPIHNGHLYVAEQVLAEIPFIDRVHFLPCKQPVHRNTPTASTAQRCEMISLAISNNAQFTLDLTEVERHSPSFAIDTLRSWRNNAANTQLYWILGMDALASLHTWRDWQAILDHCHLLVLPRPGYPIPTNQPVASLLQKHTLTDKRQLEKQPTGGIWILDIAPTNMSSTAIRAQLQQDQTVDDLPSAVQQYIQAHHLYEC